MPSKPARPRSRIVSIQVCRGLAAMAVVLAHLNNIESKYFTTHFARLWGYGEAGVDLFFVISGVVISLVTAGKFRSLRNAATFLYHRFARIYPIYWICTLLVLPVFLYHPGWVNASNHGHVEIVRSLLLIPSRYSFLIMQGWTLTYELCFYLAFAVLLLIASERMAPWFLLGWAVVAIALGLRAHPVENLLLGVATSPLILEFLAGCLLFRIYRRSRLHPAAGVAAMSAALLWMAATIVWMEHSGRPLTWIEYNLWHRVAFQGSFAFLFVFGAMELERTGVIRFARIFEAVGDWSYSIYLTHIVIVELCGRTMERYAAHSPYAIVVTTLVSLPLVLLVGWLSYTRLELPLIRLLYKRSPQRDEKTPTMSQPQTT